jgi:hypothetical protein
LEPFIEEPYSINPIPAIIKMSLIIISKAKKRKRSPIIIKIHPIIADF